MAKLDIKYVARFRARGRYYTYYRRDGAKRRLPDPGAADFWDEYTRIHKEFEEDAARAPGAAKPGSLAWLIDLYRADPKYIKKAASTRAEYDRFLDEMKVRFGDLPYRRMSIKFLYKLRDEKAHAPGMANLRLRILLALLKWAMKHGHLDKHPAPAGVEWLDLEGDGAEPWSDDEIAAVKKKAPPEVAFLIDLTVGTGQRRSDVVRMSHDDRDGDDVQVIQQKTNKPLWIPLHPELAEQIDALEHKAGVLARSERGRPYTPTNASQAVKRAAKAAGLGDLSIHGLRKSATIRLAEAGCSDHEIQAVTGHSTAEMVRKYSAKLNQRRLARQAVDRLTVKQS